jgi:Spy/CpxP family protein refolding chaperone
MKNRRIAIMLVLALCFTLSALQAQKKPETKTDSPKMGRSMMHDGFNGMQALKLTDEQKQKIEVLRLDNQKEIIKLNSEIQLNRVDIKKLFTEKELNTAKLAGLTETIGKLELKIKTLKTENWITIYNLLNDEQKGIWKKHFEKEGFMQGAMQGPAKGPGMMQKGRQDSMQGGKPGMMQGKGMMGHRMHVKDSTITKSK